MRQQNRNFILGAGEQLVETVLPPARAPQKTTPYTPQEARQRLAPRLATAVAELRKAPENSLAKGEAVAKLTLHPQFQSKSAFPSDLLADTGLRAIGSKPSRIKAEKVDRKSDSKEEPTTTLFVAGKVEAFDRFATRLSDSSVRFTDRVSEELTSIEEFQAMGPADRMADFAAEIDSTTQLECILHAKSSHGDAEIIKAFVAYAESLGLKVDTTKELFASGLCFLAVSGNIKSVEQLAWFSFLRRIRPMPRMRPLLPTKIVRAATGAPVQIPNVDPLDKGIVAAIFDTPLPTEHALNRWIVSHDYEVPPFPSEDEQMHGLCVASAATLGPLDNLSGDRSPYTVHHHGVLGQDPDNTGYHAALKTIQNEVTKNNYPLFNLSFGPDGAMLDDDVDAFTAVVDELLSNGERLGFIAVGNAGDLDDDLQLNRVQPPSDAVNALSIGASHSRQASWEKADYSCVGPGRFGCRVKPDLVTFGGSMDEPFGCIGQGLTPDRYNTQGTSFASPAAMRTAGSVMATMGNQLTPTAVRALLVHGSRRENKPVKEVGHGLLPNDIDGLLTSQENEVKILFQGFLAAGKYVQHKIPMPPDLEGMVELEATLCFATPVDPNYPSTYVQAGVEAIFRPHSERHNSVVEGGVRRETSSIQSESLFNQGRVYGGAEERRDAHLWDTVLKTKRAKRASSYNDPVIDLHYNLRQGGQPVGGTAQPEVPYALVLTLRCRSVADLYDRVRSRYGANLQVLAPRLETPIRV